MIRKKILLLGDFNVGKTSLIRRYVENTFDDTYLSTIGVKISKKLCRIEGIECELLIWDIEGATPTKKIPLSYYHGASGAIIVADVNRSETCRNIEEHKSIFLSQNPNASMVVAYNKADLLTPIQKDYFELESHMFFTSAKDNLNVEDVFIYLVKDMIK